MNKLVNYSLIALSICWLVACKGKSRPAEMPVPSISVTDPEVRDITLTKDYP